MPSIESQIGNIEYTEKEILTFVDGLFGFEHLKDFVLINGGDDSYFSYLQSIEDGAITFVVANPKEIIKDYVLSISQSDYESLGIKDSEKLEDFVIITIPEDIEDISSNLLGPIIINCETMKGKQVISQNSAYTTKYKILHELQRLAS